MAQQERSSLPEVGRPYALVVRCNFDDGEVGTRRVVVTFRSGLRVVYAYCDRHAEQVLSTKMARAALAVEEAESNTPVGDLRASDENGVPTA